ncbi:MAG: hypothetical protein AAFP88_02420 [Bacteroidota bacterium]
MVDRDNGTLGTTVYKKVYVLLEKVSTKTQDFGLVLVTRRPIDVTY